MTVHRMDHAGIVVEDLAAAVAYGYVRRPAGVITGLVEELRAG